MSAIKHILEHKGDTVHTIGPDATVLEAVEKMAGNSVGSLLVMEGPRICGIITERDYLRHIVLKGRTSRDTPVRKIMTGDDKLVFVSPNTAVEIAMAIMTEKRIRHLPVFEDGVLVGLISVGDLVKQVSRDQNAEIHYLREYIAGSYPA